MEHTTLSRKSETRTDARPPEGGGELGAAVLRTIHESRAKIDRVFEGREKVAARLKGAGPAVEVAGEA